MLRTSSTPCRFAGGFDVFSRTKKNPLPLKIQTNQIMSNQISSDHRKSIWNVRAINRTMGTIPTDLHVQLDDPRVSRWLLNQGLVDDWGLIMLQSSNILGILIYFNHPMNNKLVVDTIQYIGDYNKYNRGIPKINQYFME